MTDAEFVADLARELEELILAEGPETVAAFIAEPIQAAGGVIVPPPGYFPAIEEVLRRYDVLLIADEVVCGFGRLGRWFGTEAFGLQPDLITWPRGSRPPTSRMSASLVSEGVWDVLARGASVTASSATATPTAPTRWPRPPPSPTSPSSSGTAWSSRPPSAVPTCSERLHERSPGTRWSARCAATG